jgi:hypothetical protein
MLQIGVGVTVAILGAALLWCFYNAWTHMIHSNIANKRYRYGVVTALITFIIGEMFFLIYEFDGLKDSYFFFHLVFVFLAFPISISLDTLVLLIFRVMNPNIPGKLLNGILVITWILYATTPILGGMAYLAPVPNPDMARMATILRFVNAVWYVLYHTFQVAWLIYLIYTNIRKKYLDSVSRALKSSLKLLMMVLGLNVCGLPIYAMGLLRRTEDPMRFIFFHLAHSALAIQMNLLIDLFVFLTKLQFSDKEKKMGATPLGEPKLVTEAETEGATKAIERSRRWSWVK